MMSTNISLMKVITCPGTPAHHTSHLHSVQAPQTHPPPASPLVGNHASIVIPAPNVGLEDIRMSSVGYCTQRQRGIGTPLSLPIPSFLSIHHLYLLTSLLPSI